MEVNCANDISLVSISDTNDDFIKITSDNLEFSAYHFHHNREPFYLLFITKNKTQIYIELLDTSTKRNKFKYISDITMSFDDMAKNERLKKYYDLSVMLARNSNIIYYDKYGIESSQLISTYDTDSEDDEPDAKNVRNWCISCDIVWKNLYVNNKRNYNCYYNIDPFKFEYNINSEKEINNFIEFFNSFEKYYGISRVVENEIITNHNNKSA
jgi:hypothetical protein